MIKTFLGIGADLPTAIENANNKANDWLAGLVGPVTSVSTNTNMDRTLPIEKGGSMKQSWAFSITVATGPFV